MPRKRPRKSKTPVDATVRPVRQSPSEKEAANETAAGDSSAEEIARPHAQALADAAAYIGGGESPDRGGAASSQRIRAEQQRVEEWARSQGCLIDEREFESLTLISNSTSEHEVWYRESDGRAVKRTWPGFYGQVPIFENGRLERAPASPAQYLERQKLHNEIFDGDLRLEGVCISSKPSMIIGEPAGLPAFVVSQPFIRAENRDLATPSETQIADFFTAHGFESVSGSYFGWRRVSDGVVILDARRDNFILAPGGVVPIDLQMAVIPEIIRANTPRRRASKTRRKRA